MFDYVFMLPLVRKKGVTNLIPLIKIVYETVRISLNLSDIFSLSVGFLAIQRNYVPYLLYNPLPPHPHVVSNENTQSENRYRMIKLAILYFCS